MLVNKVFWGKIVIVGIVVSVLVVGVFLYYI